MHSRAGFTIGELAISMGLSGLLFYAAVMAAKGGMGAFRVTQGSSDAEARARRALDRVACELVSAAQSELLPDPDSAFGTKSLEFRSIVGFDGTSRTLGVPERIAFEYETGEVDDGIDNDGNGLVDDGVLVLTRDVGGADERVVLCHGLSEHFDGESANGVDDNGNGVIDEAGFSVQRVGAVLDLRLSVEEPLHDGMVVRALLTSVRLRN